jgi:hypothetical protein
MPHATATDSDPTIRFPDRMRLRAPKGLPAAIEIAARRHHTSPSEWARQTLIRGLEAEGLELVDGRIKVSR